MARFSYEDYDEIIDNLCRKIERFNIIAINQALARGYCSERNSKKVLDPDLIEDMAEEILKLHE